MKLYRSRALIMSCFVGVLWNPLICMLRAPSYPLAQSLAIVAFGAIIPLLLAWFMKLTGLFYATIFGYLIYTIVLLTYCLRASETSFAPYWIWYSFLIIFGTLLLGLRLGFVVCSGVTAVALWTMNELVSFGPSLGRFKDEAMLMESYMIHIVALPCILLTLTKSYDVVRRRTEVRAINLRKNDEEASRLAAIGENVGILAGDIQGELSELRVQILELLAYAKRNDLQLETTQNMAREIQLKLNKLRETSLKLLSDEDKVTMTQTLLVDQAAN